MMRMLILYGSQTGTAQDVSERLWRESKKFSFYGPVMPMDEYPIKDLINEEVVIFVVATTGNGEAPDNMRNTWKFLLRRNLSPHALSGMRYACLGLGDSSYAKYNFIAKKLNKRLQQLGGKMVVPIGLCDDQHDYGHSAVALTWIRRLWIGLETFGHRIIRTGAFREGIFVFKLNVNILDESKILQNLDCLRWPFKEKSIKFTVKNNERVTAEDHFQNVRLIKFNFPPDVTWNQGDVLQIRPCNPDSLVNEFFDLVKKYDLGFTEDTIVNVTKAFEDVVLPVAYSKPLTVGMVVKYIWDLNSIPRQTAFELLALKCEDYTEREKLLDLNTPECLDDVLCYVHRPKRNIIEVLQDFHHATSKLCLQVLFELFPIIQPRNFSIASGPTSGTLDLIVAVVEYKTILTTPRLGLCSNWLKSIPIETEVLGVIKSGTFSLPNDVQIPLIMVGPGTGIAPFRNILQSREGLNNSGEIVVFFGCRNKAKDYHFSEEFAQWKAKNLIELFVAFSRDQENKIYVQHLIEENKLKLSKLIKEQHAVILVAGSSKNMPKAVREAFTTVLDGDNDYIEDMIKTNRYQQETWS